MSLTRMPGVDELAVHVHTAAGQQLGPLSRRALDESVKNGDVAGADHIWMQGMTDWIPLSDAGELLENLDAPDPTAEMAALPGESDDDRQDRIFGGLVQKSWDYLEDHEFASHIDEVFLGAIITATLDTGHSLIDLSSNGTHHFLRFQSDEDKSRVIARVTHMTPSMAVSKVLGQRASVIIGYGEKLGSITKVMGAIRAEFQSGFLQDADPGTITVDGDIATGYVYCQVDMYWNIDDYVGRDYRIDYPKLTNHIGATRHALRKYLRGRFQ